MWNLISGRQIRNLIILDNKISGIAINSEKTEIICSSLSGKIRKFNIISGIEDLNFNMDLKDLLSVIVLDS